MAKKEVKQSPEQIRQRITNAMIEALSDGTPPWRQPWSGSENTGLPCNFRSKRNYRGVNTIFLMWISMLYGYSSKFWGSADTWAKQLGVMKGDKEHPAFVTFFSLRPKINPKTGTPYKTKGGRDLLIPMLREFPVFNAEQMQAPSVKSLLRRDDLLALSKILLPKNQQPQRWWEREKIAALIHYTIERRREKFLAVGKDLNNEPDFKPAEKLLLASKATISHNGSKAYYSTAEDKIVLPGKRKFESMSDYYETAFHELMHWTQDKNRVGVKQHKDEKVNVYAFNELVAEIGACILMAELGVPLADKMIEKSKGYVKDWLRHMKNDPKYIFDAATQASKAVDYLLALGGKKISKAKESDVKSESVMERAA